MARPFKDDDFLCERCGYILNGLGPEADCPECGKPAWESHPGNRVGTACRGRPGILSFLRVVGSTVRKPSRVFDRARVLHAHRVWVSLSIVLAACAILSSASYLFDEIVLNREYDIHIIFFVVIMAFILTPIFLTVMIAIEIVGIRFFGQRRQWRINWRCASNICGISSPGWFVGLLFGFICSKIFILIVLPLISFAHWTEAVPFILAAQWAPYFAGMLWFETLVYIGMRRMKFANPPEAAPEWSVEEARRARGELPDSPEPEPSDSDTMGA